MNRGGYESYFHRSQRPDYAGHYVDYGLLKSKLNQFYARRRLFLRALADGRGRIDVDAFPELASPPPPPPPTATGLVDDDDDGDGGDDGGGGGGGRGCYVLQEDDDYYYDTTGDYYCAAGGGGGGSMTGASDDGGGCGGGGGGGGAGGGATTVGAAPVGGSPPPPPRPRTMDGRDASARLTDAERREFGALLGSELGRAARFYASVLLPETRRRLLGGLDDTTTTTKKKKEEEEEEEGISYKRASSSLLEAVAFAITNVITLRQVVIRYEAFCWTFDVVVPPYRGSRVSGDGGGSFGRWWHRSTPGGGSYDPDHPVSVLLALGGVEELEREIITGAMERIHRHHSKEDENNDDDDKFNNNNGVVGGGGGRREHDDDEEEKMEEGGILVGRREDVVVIGAGGDYGAGRGGAKKADDAEDAMMTTSDIENLAAQVQSFRCLLEKTERSGGGSGGAVRGNESSGLRRMLFRDRILALGYRIMDYLLIDLQRRGLISMRGRHLKNEIEVVAKWRSSRDFGHFAYNLKDDENNRRSSSFRRNLSEIKEENVFPLFLNLVSCFLFMMNSYIIEPSSAHYAEALGSLDAVAGLMLGATPLFALTSCVAYSFWTNYNYRNPLLFAGVLQFLGNFMYANAYAYKSVELCLLGRAMTGLGAPRIINRR